MFHLNHNQEKVKDIDSHGSLYVTELEGKRLGGKIKFKKYILRLKQIKKNILAIVL